jgi:acyl phosphate:glycerol-3-phosphate acyltransferase
MPMVTFFFLCMVGYLIGAIPTGKIVAYYKGIDIQSVGTQNIGASNTYLVLGKRYALLVLIGDLGKSLLTMLAALHLLDMGPAFVVGLCIVMGNVMSVFLRFSGGKGIATSLGIFLASEPLIAFMLVLIWVVGLILVKYMMIISMLGLLLVPYMYYHLYSELLVLLSSALICCTILWRHKDKWKPKEERESPESIQL